MTGFTHSSLFSTSQTLKAFVTWLSFPELYWQWPTFGFVLTGTIFYATRHLREPKLGVLAGTRFDRRRLVERTRQKTAAAAAVCAEGRFPMKTSSKKALWQNCATDDPSKLLLAESNARDSFCPHAPVFAASPPNRGRKLTCCRRCHWRISHSVCVRPKAAQNILCGEEGGGFQLVARGYSGLLRADGRPLWDGRSPIRHRAASPEEHRQWLIVRNSRTERRSQ